MALNAPGLPNGRSQPGDADLHQRLIIVVGQEVGLENVIIKIVAVVIQTALSRPDRLT